jgi:hypothetical protein
MENSVTTLTASRRGLVLPVPHCATTQNKLVPYDLKSKCKSFCWSGDLAVRNTPILRNDHSRRTDSTSVSRPGGRYTNWCSTRESLLWTNGPRYSDVFTQIISYMRHCLKCLRHERSPCLLYHIIDYSMNSHVIRPYLVNWLHSSFMLSQSGGHSLPMSERSLPMISGIVHLITRIIQLSPA